MKIKYYRKVYFVRQYSHTTIQHTLCYNIAVADVSYYFIISFISQVLTAQLRASQIENRHLRRCGIPLQLQQLQDAYVQSTEALEVKIIYFICSLCNSMQNRFRFSSDRKLSFDPCFPVNLCSEPESIFDVKPFQINQSLIDLIR